MKGLASAKGAKGKVGIIHFGNTALGQKVQSIIDVGSLRDGYNEVFMDLTTSWLMYLDDEVVLEMLSILDEAGKRILSGRCGKVDSVATYIAASLKRNTCNLSSAEAVRVLEVFGIMFRCGGLVTASIKSNYSNQNMRIVLDKILWEYREMNNWRRMHGNGTVTEIQYARNLFKI